MLFPLILTLGVLLVNGWTDAPGAIATAVTSGAVKYKKACFLCALFNFLGIILATFISSEIAEFVYSLGTFNSYATVGICIVLLTMIAFGIISAFFGMPSSESHAMLSAMAGVACAVKFDTATLKKLGEVFGFMAFSCFLALVFGFVSKKLFKRNLPYKRLQGLTLSLNSFMHGWQGGLKFIGIIAYLLNIKILDGNIPVALTAFIAVILALGSLMGGKKIINSMENLTTLDLPSAFATDISTYFTLLICSLMGMPVSTGNIKCVAIMGVGLAGKHKIDKKTATKLITCFIAVFPICFFMGYFLMKLFMSLS